MTNVDYYVEMMKEAEMPEYKSREYNLRKIYIILDMAQRGVIPNGQFSDDDVFMWEYFRKIMRQVSNGDFTKDAA
jgi:hypothetical protein